MYSSKMQDEVTDILKNCGYKKNRIHILRCFIGLWNLGGIHCVTNVIREPFPHPKAKVKE